MNKICFVGEYKNEFEETKTLLHRIIQSAGGDLSCCSFDYVSNLEAPETVTTDSFKFEHHKIVELPTYTKKGNISKVTKKSFQKIDEFKEAIEQLRKRLYDSKPNLVVACGANIFNVLCGSSSILNYRGSILDSTLIPGLKILPIVHPRWIMEKAQWEYYYLTTVDVKKALYEATFPEIKRKAFNSIIAPSFQVCIDYLESLRQANCLWSFDIETRARSIACIGFCYDSTTLCIPIQTTTGPAWKPEEEAILWKKVSGVFSNNPQLIGQNIIFDLDWMLDYGIEASGIHLDTMVGQFILSPEMPKGLDYICTMHTDAVYYKDEGKTWNSKIPDEQLWLYNCKDTFYTLQAAYEIEKQLCNQGLWSLWEDYGRKLIPICLEIQKRGLEVDSNAQRELQETILEEYHRLRPEVIKSVGHEINVNSSAAVQNYITKDLCIPLKKKRGRDSVTADETALMGLLTKPLSKTVQKKVHPCYKENLTLIMKERHIRKAGTYAGIKIQSGGDYSFDPSYQDTDGFVRSSVNICGTKTWRFSMAENPHGTGWNLQTDPKWHRTAFPAPVGRIFIQPDQKQAEARVVAYYAKCKKQIELFNDASRSIHLEFGSKVFNRVLSKDTPEYTAAKSGVHGGNFRMQADRLASTTGISVEICEKAINGYHSLYPEIRINYHNWLKDEVMAKGYLRNEFGLKRHFYHAIGGLTLTGKLSNDDWNDICSWLPQSTVPFITNLTLLAVCAKLDYVWIHQQGHDAFLLSVPGGKERETADTIITESNKISISIKGAKLTIPWEITMGYNWGQMYERAVDYYKRADWESDVEKDKQKGGYSRAKVIKSIYGVL